MSQVRLGMPTIKRIVAAQADLVVRAIGEKDPTLTCWACRDRRKLFRAHIVAHCNDGNMDPSNFFLLCRECHTEQPDNSDPSVQIAWLLYHDSRTTIDMRTLGETITCIVRRAEETGVPIEEVAAYTKTRAASGKLRVGEAGPLNFRAIIGEMKGLLLDYLPVRRPQ